MSIYRRKWLIPCDFIVMCYCNASVPWCIVVMYNHCDASSLWCINVMHQERYTWLVICDVWLVWCMYDECWWVNDECWCIKDDERMRSVDDEWMMNVYGWMIMNVAACLWVWDVCWMVYDALMHLWCMMQWCMLNMLMCVKYMYIFCHHNCIL